MIQINVQTKSIKKASKIKRMFIYLDLDKNMISSSLCLSLSLWFQHWHSVLEILYQKIEQNITHTRTEHTRHVSLF